MSTAVSAPWARWSALPGVVLALSLVSEPAKAGFAPVAATSHWDVATVSQTTTDLSTRQIQHATESAALPQSKTQSEPVNFEIFQPGSEVAGQAWPIGNAGAVRAENSQAPASNAQLGRPAAENSGTAIPVPPALQSGLCGMTAIGLVALGRRARRALR